MEDSYSRGDVEVLDSPGTEIVRADVVGVLARSEIDAQILTAKRFPRSIHTFGQRALSLATLTEESARSCWYSLKRWDATKNQEVLIEGPSIRLAEIAATAYGNLRITGRIVREDEFSLMAQGICLDLENNVGTQIDVRRSIMGRSGKRYKQDMIITTGNAAVSLARRNAILATIPRSALIDPLLIPIKEVGRGGGKSIEDLRKMWIPLFIGKWKVPKERIYATLGVNGRDDVMVQHIDQLIGFNTAIEQGMLTIEQIFGGDKELGSKPSQTQAEELAAKVAAQAAETPPEPDENLRMAGEEG